MISAAVPMLLAYGDPLLMDGVMERAFLGGSAEAVAGFIEATADADTWFGFFGAER